MPELKSRVKHYLKFSKSELRDIIVIAVAMAVILGFDDGRESFSLLPWTFNLLNCFLISLLALIVFMLPIKLLAIAKGYIVEFRQYLWGFVGGILIGLASIGKLVLFNPFELIFTHHEGLRLGRFRYGLNYFEMAVISIMGPLANLLLAVLFKLVYSVHPSFAVLNAIRLNVMFAIATLLPIPKTAGSYVFFGGRTLFVFVFTLVFGLGIALLFLSFWPSLLIGLGFCLLLTIIYFVAVEYS